jgi:hypothetical protein
MKLRLLWSVLAALPMAAGASGSSGTASISSFNVDTWDQLVSITGSWANPDGCGVSSFAVIQMSTPNYKDMLAAVMLASASGKTVSLWFNGCFASPWGNAPSVTLITVNN